ncbi:hypothetical protein [Kytococcus sedentarius]|uniref:hypothetical protein n=1 Tax=Kytococcus sedentarius TaxID=1276 RepID=UPI001951E579|nr:hypothetical protein [Kytococcus sedentarius]QRO87612.1 hypothetical protein I6J30_01095 [Kytococcus sedentarius]
MQKTRAKVATIACAALMVSGVPAFAEGSWGSWWDDVSRYTQSRRAENKFNDQNLIVWADGCTWGDNPRHAYYDTYDLYRVKLQLVRDRPLWHGETSSTETSGTSAMTSSTVSTITEG